MRMTQLLLSLILVPLVLGSAPAFAASGVQVTRDGGRTLVSKDVGNERWAISFNLDDQTATGNIFRSDGGEAAFVWCKVESNDGTTMTLSCYGADRCPNAPCDQSQWGFIANVDLPAQFFLPPGAPPLASCPVSLVTNGAKSSQANSYWDCHVVGAFPSNVFNFRIFEDGTGFSSSIGAFDFSALGCGFGTVDAGNGQSVSITNFTGTRESGVLKYHQQGLGLDNDIVCSLVRL